MATHRKVHHKVPHHPARTTPLDVANGTTRLDRQVTAARGAMQHDRHLFNNQVPNKDVNAHLNDPRLHGVVSRLDRDEGRAIGLEQQQVKQDQQAQRQLQGEIAHTHDPRMRTRLQSALGKLDTETSAAERQLGQDRSDHTYEFEPRDMNSVLQHLAHVKGPDLAPTPDHLESALEGGVDAIKDTAGSLFSLARTIVDPKERQQFLNGLGAIKDHPELLKKLLPAMGDSIAKQAFYPGGHFNLYHGVGYTAAMIAGPKGAGIIAKALGKTPLAAKILAGLGDAAESARGTGAARVVAGVARGASDSRLARGAASTAGRVGRSRLGRGAGKVAKVVSRSHGKYKAVKATVKGLPGRGIRAGARATARGAKDGADRLGRTRLAQAVGKSAAGRAVRTIGGKAVRGVRQGGSHVANSRVGLAARETRREVGWQTSYGGKGGRAPVGDARHLAAVKTFQRGAEDLRPIMKKLDIPDGVLAKGVKGPSKSTMAGIEHQLMSGHASIDGAGAPNVDHQFAVLARTLQKMHSDTKKPLTQGQVDEATRLVFGTDSIGKGPQSADTFAKLALTHNNLGDGKAVLARIGTDKAAMEMGTMTHGSIDYRYIRDQVGAEARARAADGLPPWSKAEQKAITRQTYFTNLAHHYSGFPSNLMAKHGYTPDFAYEEKVGHLPKGAAKVLTDLHDSATGLAKDGWRQKMDAATASGKPFDMAGYQRAAAPYRKAMAELKKFDPKAYDQLVQDDVGGQFNRIGIEKWANIAKFNPKAKTNEGLIDSLKDTANPYAWENEGRGTGEEFLANSSPTLAKGGLIWKDGAYRLAKPGEKTTVVEGGKSVTVAPFKELADGIRHDPELKPPHAHMTDEELVAWFEGQSSDPAALTRIMQR